MVSETGNILTFSRIVWLIYEFALFLVMQLDYLINRICRFADAVCRIDERTLQLITFLNSKLCRLLIAVNSIQHFVVVHIVLSFIQ